MLVPAARFRFLGWPPRRRWLAGLVVALVALELVLPTGCIGVEAILGKKQSFATSTAYLTGAAPRAGGTTRFNSYGQPGSGRWGGGQVVSTSAEVLALWGPPDQEQHLKGRDVWTYRAKGLKWKGLWVWALLVPVPLQVPTGRNQLRLEFEAGQLRQVTVQCRGRKFYGINALVGVRLGRGDAFDAETWQCSP